MLQTAAFVMHFVIQLLISLIQLVYNSVVSVSFWGHYCNASMPGQRSGVEVT